MTPIYFTDNVIKVKCISNTDKDNKQHLITIGDIYNAFLIAIHGHEFEWSLNSTTFNKSAGKYYFINETKTAVPVELFITIDELREQQLNTILLSSRSSLPND